MFLSSEDGRLSTCFLRRVRTILTGLLGRLIHGVNMQMWAFRIYGYPFALGRFTPLRLRASVEINRNAFPLLLL